jgi:hypothetical protein
LWTSKKSVLHMTISGVAEKGLPPPSAAAVEKRAFQRLNVNVVQQRREPTQADPPRAFSFAFGVLWL